MTKKKMTAEEKIIEGLEEFAEAGSPVLGIEKIEAHILSLRPERTAKLKSLRHQETKEIDQLKNKALKKLEPAITEIRADYIKRRNGALKDFKALESHWNQVKKSLVKTLADLEAHKKAVASLPKPKE